ncbi:aminoglycoside phosphotransferase family protein [Isachenkonia alkalipeptolytica]|uniref:Phosphotransferase family protein n=1 Tax=Isachenkonia alkalipeptolytica TaxID=2565777 RepID=A0AA43XKG9_9CLOT|nr:phosphotransferase [Isachenkonia alkalipeptolytica]NBG88488.1 phosphotransferase family protein [Isachenkonia alkalipeptolytica]
MTIYQDILGARKWKKVEEVKKGWSLEKKFKITLDSGETRLLRIVDREQTERKQREFKLLSDLKPLNIWMSTPIETGICNGGKSVYTLFTWLEGQDAEILLPKYSLEKQYALGKEAGEILKKLHSYSAPKRQPQWEKRYNEKIDLKIKAYQQCGDSLEGDQYYLKYINENRHLLIDRPQCFQHGDYHIGNMILNDQRELGIIDFNRFNFGDPWEEFNRITFSAEVSTEFAIGQIHGYFRKEVPLKFFKLLKFYIAVNQIAALPWALEYGRADVEIIKELSQKTLKSYGDFIASKPNWYREKSRD